uniref:PH domain-containing protein n=1 Tax=Phytophthora ramorum TaxID=164328 RepID=H3HE15_PHYRM
MLSRSGSGASSQHLTRQCTCAAETESDSDNESDAGPTGNGSEGSNKSGRAPLTEWAHSLSLLELTKNSHDPLKASQALHNAEALRQAPALDNVFCSCYDVDTVLSTVQRREKGHFSPVQKLLLEPESIKQDAGQDEGQDAGPSVKLEGLAVSSTQKPPTNMTTMMDFRSNASTRKMARIQRLRASMRFESSDSSISDFSLSGDEEEDLLEDPTTRGYLLRVDGEESDNGSAADEEVEVDSVLVANMCRITKNFVTFPAVHRLICDENMDEEKEWLLSRLAAHAYNPDIASLLHGLIHLAGTDSSSAIDVLCVFYVDGFVYFVSVSTIVVGISGCAEILLKILKEEFPNTFRFYMQTKIQLSSFESVGPFERELFPPRTAPSDPAMHQKLKDHASSAQLFAEIREDCGQPPAIGIDIACVKLYLNLLNRPTSNGRVNNPLLRSIFRSPDSILEFILHKLNKSSSAHIYDAHLAIVGVKIAKICSSPTLQQELIRQFCNNMEGWNDFASSLVASHYQHMDALDDSLLALQVISGGPRNGAPRRRNASEDEIDTGFPLARPSSSASEYLSRELEPFRRLPMEKEGFGSSQNLASGNEAVHPSDMFQSRSQSKFPESIIDILRSDESTSFNVEEDDFFVSGYAYQKRSKWIKVHLKFEKATCQLTLQDATDAPSGSPRNGGQKATSPSKASMLKQFLMAQKQTWTSRPKKLVVCNARKWIAFGRSLKNPDRGAFGFQIEVFDGHREEDETLTFVTRPDATRMRWFEAMQCAVTRTRTSRNSFSDIDEAANTSLVECVAKNRDGSYLVVPDINLLGPMASASFFIKSEVPEEMPFWGIYHGDLGISKYASLFKQCLDVVSVEEKSIQAIGYSVIVEFDATFRRSENIADFDDSEPPSVKCACTDTYLVSGNQIIAPL